MDTISQAYEECQEFVKKQIMGKYHLSETKVENLMIAVEIAESRLSDDPRMVSIKDYGRILCKSAGIKPNTRISKYETARASTYKGHLIEDIINEPLLKDATLLDKANYAVASYLYDIGFDKTRN